MATNTKATVAANTSICTILLNELVLQASFWSKVENKKRLHKSIMQELKSASDGQWKDSKKGYKERNAKLLSAIKMMA